MQARARIAATGIGAWLAMLAGSVVPAAAAPGDVLWTVTGSEQTHEVGSRVAGAGDLDADGRADLLTVSQHLGIGMLVYGRTDGATVDMVSLIEDTPSPDGDSVIDGVGGSSTWAALRPGSTTVASMRTCHECCPASGGRVPGI